jgi:hypothetical protein
MKKTEIFVLIILILLGSPKLTTDKAEQEEYFMGQFTEVTDLELELALFDLKANLLFNMKEMFPEPMEKKFPELFSSDKPVSFVEEISSLFFPKPSQIMSIIKVNPSIMNGNIEVRKERIKNLCEHFFKVYKSEFHMRRKEPGDMFMKEHNLIIDILVTLKSYNIGIATWENGRINYKEDFINWDLYKRYRLIPPK